LSPCLSEKMLFFTYRQGERIRAVYNGRFAFLHCYDPAERDSILALRGENDFEKLWAYRQAGTTANAASVIVHEYMHKQIYGLSPVGWELTGWRLFARLRFVLLGDRPAITAYYRARAIYYFHTLDYHETLSTWLSENDATEAVDRFQQFEEKVKREMKGTITEADQAVKRAWKAAKVQPFFLFQPLYFRMGRWMQSSFSIGITARAETDAPTATLTWTADGGIPNDIDQVRTNETRRIGLIKRLISKGIVNHLNRWQTFAQVFEWCWVGQRAQFACYQELTGVSREDYLRDYLHPMLGFVMEWAALPAEHHGITLEIFEDLLTLEKSAFDDKWRVDFTRLEAISAFRTVFGFFFLHGN